MESLSGYHDVGYRDRLSSVANKRRSPHMSVMTTTSIHDIELHADNLDPNKAAALYEQHGCVVVRGLMKPWAEGIRQDIERSVAQAIAQLESGAGQQITEGLKTPDGTLWLPAPANFKRKWQIMVLRAGYRISGTFFHSALHPPMLDIAEAILGPNVELFGDGQCLYKEPVGGHPKHLHQDAAYFEHRFQGPLAMLGYAVDTDLEMGALHVVPGSHKLGVLRHVDTFSHLGLDANEWPWDKALPIEGKAGDAIFFSVKTIHGSKENHSTRPRPVFIHRYRNANDYVIISATTTANRDEAAKHVKQAKSDNEQGLMVRGWREYDPNR